VMVSGLSRPFSISRPTTLSASRTVRTAVLTGSFSGTARVRSAGVPGAMMRPFGVPTLRTGAAGHSTSFSTHRLSVASRPAVEAACQRPWPLPNRSLAPGAYGARLRGLQAPLHPRHATQPCGTVRFKAAARRLRRCPSGSLEPASPARLADAAPPRWRGEWLGPFTSISGESLEGLAALRSGWRGRSGRCADGRLGGCIGGLQRASRAVLCCHSVYLVRGDGSGPLATSHANHATRVGTLLLESPGRPESLRRLTPRLPFLPRNHGCAALTG
jgi:hypothetical protein